MQRVSWFWQTFRSMNILDTEIKLLTVFIHIIRIHGGWYSSREKYLIRDLILTEGVSEIGISDITRQYENRFFFHIISPESNYIFHMHEECHCLLVSNFIRCASHFRDIW